jgi:hypothetical protein
MVVMHKFFPLIKSILDEIRIRLKEEGTLDEAINNKEDNDSLNLLEFEIDIITAGILLLFRSTLNLNADDVIFVSHLQQLKIMEQEIIDLIRLGKKSPNVRI